MILSYIKLRSKIFRNYIKSLGPTFIYKGLFKICVFFLILLGFCHFLIYMFGFARTRDVGVDFEFAGAFFSFSLFIFMPFLFFSAMVGGLNNLFDKKELPFLLSHPISVKKIFVIRFCKILFETGWMTFFIILIFSVAMKDFFGIEGLFFYLFVIVGAFCFLTIFVCLGVWLVLFLCRYFPFYRSKDFLAGVGIIISGVLIAMLRFLRPERLVTHSGKLSMVKFIQGIHTPWLTFLPNEWMTNICVGFYKSNFKVIYQNIFALLILCLFCIIGTAVLVHLLYFRGVQRVWESSDRYAFFGRGVFISVAKRFLPDRLLMLARKDFLNIYRDVVQRSSFFLLIVLCAIYFYNIYAIPVENIFSYFFRIFFNYFLASLVVIALGARWGFASLSSEGRNFRLFKSAPIRLADVLRYRFIIGYLPLLILAEFLVMVACFMMRLDLFMKIFSALNIALVTYVVVRIGVHLGALLADFHSDDPLEFLQGYNGLLYIVICGVYVVGVLVIEAIPVWIYIIEGFPILTPLKRLLFIGPSILAVLFSFLFAWYPTKFSLRRLNSLDL